MSEWIVTVTVKSEDGYRTRAHSKVQLTAERPEVEVFEQRTMASEKPISYTTNDGADRDLLTRLISKAADAADAGVLLR